MTTTPTPVERAAAELFDRFDIDADGYVLADVPEERTGYVEHATAVLSAALDVNEIARVLDRHAVDEEDRYGNVRCACAETAWLNDAIAHHDHVAAALIEHLTLTGATR